MLRPFVLLAAVATVAAAPVHAAGIDLSKPHGNKSGCINKDGQQVYAEDMLLVTASELVTAASACTILQKRAQEDGSLLLNTMCEVEGEDGKSPADFTIRPSPKNRNRLVLADDSGFVMGEVAQCR